MLKGLFDFKSHKVKCPDGSIKFVYKDVNDAFPLFIPGFTGNVTGGVEGWDNIKGSINADYATKIQGLIFQLSELTEGVMFDFRASYISFMADPCANNLFFQNQVANIIQEQRRLRNLSIQIKGLITLAQANPANSELILKHFVNVADQIGGKPALEAIAIEIDSNRDAATTWANSGEFPINSGE